MRKPKTGNEQKSVKPKVRKLLTQHGWFWWATPATMYSQSGIADLCAIKSGMFMAVETKFGRRDPTPLQVAYLNSVRAEDHFAFIVRDTTIAAFARFLTALDKSIEFASRREIAPAEIGGAMLDAIKEMGDSEVLNPAAFDRASKAAAQRRGTHASAPHDDPDDGRAGDGRGEGPDD